MSQWPRETSELAEELVRAVKKNDKPNIRRLLEARVSGENISGSSYHPLCLAARFGWDDLVARTRQEEKLDNWYYNEALMHAAEHGHRSTTHLLLSYIPQSMLETGESDPAFAAVIGGQVELLKDLMAHGMTTNLKDACLLEESIKANHSRMVDFLLDHGADLPYAWKVFNSADKTLFPIGQVLSSWKHRQEVYNDAASFTRLHDLRPPILHPTQRPTVCRFVHMARSNRFHEVVEHVVKNPQDGLYKQDLLHTDHMGNTVLEILGARNQLKEVLHPTLWRGREKELQALFELVPPVYVDQIDKEALTAQIHLNVLRTRTPAAQLRPK